MIDGLSSFGLQVLGTCAAIPSDGVGTGTLVLIGPDEPAFWPIFSASSEYQDGAPDPMDRWSRRVLDGLAADASGRALFPFGGPPYAPFQTWAVRTGRAWPSPIGFLVHDQAGLCVSFRGAILLPQDHVQMPKVSQPCTSCAKPCVSACPVGAFNDGYDVAACKAHVISAAGEECRNQGCLARSACPVGKGNRIPAQAAFHMEAFL